MHMECAHCQATCLGVAVAVCINSCSGTHLATLPRLAGLLLLQLLH
jgi:hypothetical protein